MDRSTFPPRGWDAREIITLDGLRVEYADGFGLARPSNTTPVIVLRALTRDREDGCVLNLAILVIVGLIIALGLSFLLSS